MITKPIFFVKMLKSDDFNGNIIEYLNNYYKSFQKSKVLSGKFKGRLLCIIKIFLFP